MKENSIGLVVFDWAGTTVDYGCIAPLELFRRCFEPRGIFLSPEEIRKPMGLEKKDHIRTLVETETASEQWRARYGKEWTEEDVQAIYESFEEMLKNTVAEYSQVLPGVEKTVKELREKGIRIGSSTGYTREIMEIVMKEAKKGGYEPDFLVTPQDVNGGRPAPFMIYENMRLANVYPPCRVVKVGDTAADILEGRSGSVWTVGILEGSSAAAMTEEERRTLSAEEVEKRKDHARKIYEEAGADYVIDSILELPLIIEKIEERMEKEHETGKKSFL